MNNSQRIGKVLYDAETLAGMLVGISFVIAVVCSVYIGLTSPEPTISQFFGNIIMIAGGLCVLVVGVLYAYQVILKQTQGFKGCYDYVNALKELDALKTRMGEGK